MQPSLPRARLQLCTFRLVMGKGGAAKGKWAGIGAYSAKDIKDLAARHQFKNLSGLLKTLDALGVTFKERV